MLYAFAKFLAAHWYSGFNIFAYITVRSIAGALTALFISLAVGPTMIRRLTAMKIGQMVRDDGPQSHLVKAGTPTMGGALILVSITAAILLWGDLRNVYVWVAIFTTLAFGAIGFVDDYQKLVKGNSKGLSAKAKYFWQSITAFGVAIFLYNIAATPAETELLIPYFKSTMIDIGPGFILLTYLVIVGTSNAVNLTDGLDGLATMPTLMVAGALAIFAYVSGHVFFAEYLNVPYVPGVGELAVFCAAMVGACLGFLWFNAYPAEVFMGDVGSLPLGAALGVVAVMVRHELVLFIMGGVFVMEAVSVILQVGSYKMRGKRIFLMAPLHHHFEQHGWPETRVTVRFWIISFVLVLVGLASLKVR